MTGGVFWFRLPYGECFGEYVRIFLENGGYVWWDVAWCCRSDVLSGGDEFLLIHIDEKSVVYEEIGA